MKHIPISLALLFGLAAAGCSVFVQPTPTVEQPTLDPSVEPVSTAGLSRVDEQGAVTVVVEPINLDSPGETLDFEVSMDTHSVDLSMDLTALATLTTNTELTASAVGWDAPRGGHHVSGKLSFPASVNGISLLQGATELILTLRNVDAPERIFKWELPT